MFGRGSKGDEPAEGKTAPKEGDMLTIKEAAEYLGISEMRVRTLVREGRLEGAEMQQVKDTSVKRWVIPVEGLDLYSETKGTFGGGSRAGGKAWIVRVEGPEPFAALETFCKNTTGVSGPFARYKYDPEKQKAYRIQRKAKLAAAKSDEAGEED